MSKRASELDQSQGKAVFVWITVLNKPESSYTSSGRSSSPILWYLSFDWDFSRRKPKGNQPEARKQAIQPATKQPTADKMNAKGRPSGLTTIAGTPTRLFACLLAIAISETAGKKAPAWYFDRLKQRQKLNPNQTLSKEGMCLSSVSRTG